MATTTERQLFRPVEIGAITLAHRVVMGPDHPIAISPAEGAVRVTVAGRIVAESRRALRLEEKGYPSVYYLHPADGIHGGTRRSC
jgi:uncharacterized protein (DUF427 family)